MYGNVNNAGVFVTNVRITSEKRWKLEIRLTAPTNERFAIICNVSARKSTLHKALAIVFRAFKILCGSIWVIFVIDFLLFLSESVRAVISNAVVVITHRYRNKKKKESDTYVVAVLKFYFVGNEEKKIVVARSFPNEILDDETHRHFNDVVTLGLLKYILL